MKWDVQVSTNGQQPYSDTRDLTSYEENMPPYAYCLPRYSRMDGSIINAPAVLQSGENGYISNHLSSADGNFLTPPVLTITLDRLKTSNGLLMVFNRATGDYPSQIDIIWYKDGNQVAAQSYEPDGVEYFCRAKVPLFNKMVITFKKTSKPYRYVWVSMIRNQRLTDAGGLRIVYDDIALGAKEDADAQTDDKMSYVNLGDLKTEREFPDYGLCLPRYARLDGNYNNAPDIWTDIGYISSSISDANGIFLEPPILTFSFQDSYTSIGLTLQFNDYSGDFCSLINIQWFWNDELLSEQEYEPNSSNFFCYNLVEHYNRVSITFKRTSKPFRNVFLSDILWGLIRNFKDDEIEDCGCLMEINPISEEVTVNTLDYTIRSQNGYAFEFQKRQKQILYFDEAILGIFYLSDGKQLSKDRYTINAQDIIGVLDNKQFAGGVYNDILVEEIIKSIMTGEDTQYFLDESYSNTKLSGYLPICSKRAALQQIAFAVGAVIDTAYDRQMYLYPQPTEIRGEFNKKDIFTGLTIEHSDIITGIRLHVHNYVAAPGETTEIYNGALNGTAEISFSEPYHSLSITNGTLIDYGDNYAVISGQGGEVVLTGIPYLHTTTVITKEDPRITKDKTIAEIKEATLVTSGNAQDVLNRVYDYYRNNESVSCQVVITQQELGDIVQIDTDYRGVKTGTITRMNYRFTREVTAEVTIQ